MAEQYDTVGNKYEQFKDTAALPIPERHTFLKLVGDLHGQRALDLACGAGYYTRLLKQQGAENVIGVDVSPEMVAIARQREQEHRQGIQYHVANAAQLPHLGDFHLVTAIYLLNYASTREELLGMCRGAHTNLEQGGRFIAFTIDPNFVLEKGHWESTASRCSASGSKGSAMWPRRASTRFPPRTSNTSGGPLPPMSGP
ncbi:class I SAM-dependent methyltransferase [Cystobacter fuscus]